MYQLFDAANHRVQLWPEYDYSREDTKIESLQRAQSGKLYRYQFGIYQRWRFTVNYLALQDATQINQWWRDDTVLTWQEEQNHHSGIQLVNQKLPIGQMNPPYHQLFGGVIELESQNPTP